MKYEIRRCMFYPSAEGSNSKVVTGYGEDESLIDAAIDAERGMNRG